MTVNADLGAHKAFVADIPWPGTFFVKDQALVSVYGRGPTLETALALLDKHISTVRQYIR
jgi:predicted ATP-grasp superfamily ATP-dependent carboligase